MEQVQVSYWTEQSDSVLKENEQYISTHKIWGFSLKNKTNKNMKKNISKLH